MQLKFRVRRRRAGLPALQWREPVEMDGAEPALQFAREWVEDPYRGGEQLGRLKSFHQELAIVGLEPAKDACKFRRHVFLARDVKPQLPLGVARNNCPE